MKLNDRLIIIWYDNVKRDYYEKHGETAYIDPFQLKTAIYSYYKWLAHELSTKREAARVDAYVKMQELGFGE